MEITKDTLIEEIVNANFKLVDYLSEKGIRCIRCGEPIWGTLDSAAKEKNFTEEQIQIFVNDLNEILKSV